ncbi:hypothetical protein NM688_g8155 [Phlebia brevispora]|uniref:Uncharacterized protein n=1 Tax=Phlebia brevispora TaxID=194682 RepID=A0ACC1RWL7_9APHY|nr:hypothetical protein NM688_g8155 [Phlebia brevispora]
MIFPYEKDPMLLPLVPEYKALNVRRKLHRRLLLCIQQLKTCKMVLWLFLVASFLTLVSAIPHESLLNIPEEWQDLGPAPADKEITLYIAMVESSLNTLLSKLEDVSTPGSGSYGQYPSALTILPLLLPNAQAVPSVTGWLNTVGAQITSRPLIGTWLQTKLLVGNANQLLDTTFHLYKHKKTNEEIVRTQAYSIPENLNNFVDLVYPTVHFGHRWDKTPIDLSRERTDLTKDHCDAKAVTPYCIQQLYGVPRTLATKRTQRLGVIGLNGQYANEADLKMFLEQFRPDFFEEVKDPNGNVVQQLKPGTGKFDVKKIAGGQNLQDLDKAGGEANLDTQYTVGIASAVPNIFLTVGGGDLPDDLLWIFVLLSESDNNLPRVISLSYGTDERYLTSRLAKKICTAYAALALRGVSVISASGDGGVGGTSAEEHQNCEAFVPAFPTCPYITTVGATALVDGKTPLDEQGADFSGGGFSTFFPAPAWQHEAVDHYLSTASIPDDYVSKFNRGGRAFPDVSTIGSYIAVKYQGHVGTIDGTSASAPIFASMIALINDARAAENKPPLGFLNPFLYRNPGLFKDITSGNNPGCNTQGFSATVGWDPVTGLGTPRFEALKEAALKFFQSTGYEYSWLESLPAAEDVHASPSIHNLERSAKLYTARSRTRSLSEINSCDQRLIARRGVVLPLADLACVLVPASLVHVVATMASEESPLLGQSVRNEDEAEAVALHEAVYDRFSASRKRLIVALSALSGSFPMFASGSFLPLIPQIAYDLHSTGQVVSLAVSLSILGASIGSMIWASYSSFYGRRPIILVSLAIMCTGSIGAGIARSVPELLFWRVTQAFWRV